MFKGWKTLIVAIIFGTLGVLQGIDWMTLLTTPASFGWAALGMSMAMMVMRAFTDTPIMKPNAVASVDAMPEIAGVIPADTPEGRALAASVPSKTVAVAGSTEAKIVAGVGGPQASLR